MEITKQPYHSLIIVTINVFSKQEERKNRTGRELNRACMELK